MKKLLVVMGLVLALLVVGCGSSSETADSNGSSETGNSSETKDNGSNDKTSSAERTEVTILGSIKGEIATEFEGAVEVYNASQDAYTLTILPQDAYTLTILPLDGNAMEKLQTMYASNNAPTIFAGGQEMAELKDKLLDVSGEDLISHAFEGSTQLVTDGDRIYGIPITIEAFGLLYNKEVAAGVDGFDAASINTQDALNDYLSAAGMSLSPMDWSLGAHFTNVLFGNQGGTHEERMAFMDGLKDGSVTLADDAVYNGWVDALDILLANNKYGSFDANVLAPTYDDSTLDLAIGEVGGWFMGNWANPGLIEMSGGGDFGILPIPVSNDANYQGNKSISVGVPMYFAIDAEQSSAEEQAGALDFINWLLNTEEGHKHYVNEFKMLPVYDHVKEVPADSLSQDILAYASEGNTLEWMNMQYPSSAYPAMGASMQKYIAGEIDRVELATEIEDYWKAQ